VIKPFKLTQQQAEAKKLIIDFMHPDNPQRIFKLAGFAGVGKTTLMKVVRDEAPVPTKLCAYTGKAANNLNIRLGTTVATTLHKLIYQLEGEHIDPKTKKVIPHFSPVPLNLSGQIVILDEFSLVNQQNGQDLMNTYAKILAVGDLFQLLPIEGEPFIRDFDYQITQVTRQGKDSGITRQLTNLRSNLGLLEEDDDVIFIPKLKNDYLLNASIVLCFTRKERYKTNCKIRALRGYKEDIAKEGETVTALINNERYGVYNGSSYRLLRDFDLNDEGAEIIIEMEDGSVNSIPKAVFVPDGCEVSDFPLYARKKYDCFFDFGYCQTVHKSQGSEWPKPFLIDDYYKNGVRPKNWRNWLYTAVSRATLSITYFNKG
jgi:exodeoxyribonuclease-5